MRLHWLELSNVKGVVHRRVAVADLGVTLIEGPNEAGKTTLLEGLDALLTHPDRARSQVIRRLQPVGRDVGPEVAAELTVVGQRLVYRKRWLRDPMTELVLLEPPAGSFTGREAHDRVEALLREGLDTDLWAALRLQQGTSWDLGEALARSTSLGRALELAGTTTPGSGASLLERALAERDRYYSPRRLDPRGDLRAAQERVASCQAEAEVLRARLASWETSLEELGELRRHQARLATEREAVRARLALVTEQAEAVSQAEVELRVARSSAEAAQAACGRLAELRRRRQDLAAELARAERELTEHQVRSNQLHQALRAAEAREDQIRQQLLAVQSAREQVGERLRWLLVMTELAERREQAAELEERLARAQSALEQRSRVEAELGRLMVDDPALVRLERLDAECRAATQAAGAVAPSVVLEALGALDGVLDGAALRLRPGERAEWRPDQRWELELPGLLRLQVHPPGEARSARHAREEAEAALVELCAELQVPDLATARAQAARRRELIEERIELDRTLDRIAGEGGVEVLARVARSARAEVQTLARSLAAAPAELATLLENPGALARAREQAEVDLQSAQGQLVGLEAEAHAVRSALDELRGQVTQVDAVSAQLEQMRVQRAADLVAERQRLADSDLEAAWVEASAQAEAAGQHLLVQEERFRAQDPGGVRARLAATQEALAELDQEERATVERAAELRGAVSGAAAEGLASALAEAEAALAEARRVLERVERRATAARLLAEVLVRAEEQARSRYAEPLAEAVGALASSVLGEPVRVDLDERLAPVTLRRGEVLLPVDQLSAGTQEQLALVLRMAAAQVVARGTGEPLGVPVVFDDVLGFSDADRLERLVGVLRVVGQDAQVLMLTCHPERYRGLGAARVERVQRSWPPARAQDRAGVIQG